MRVKLTGKGMRGRLKGFHVINEFSNYFNGLLSQRTFKSFSWRIRKGRQRVESLAMTEKTKGILTRPLESLHVKGVESFSRFENVFHQTNFRANG